MRYRPLIVSWLPAAGMAITPFILLRKRSYLNDPVLLNHEKIHLRQQMELLILPFYLLYLAFYLLNLARFRQHDKAYMHIPFEREAYKNETNLDYLSIRKRFAWFRPL